MEIFIDIIIIAVCIAALWFGAVWVVGSASLIARRFGLSELVIGLTIVAIATSAPEFAVTVYAAFTGKAAISVGNIVGSDIFNLGIILGIVALHSILFISKTLFYRDGFLLFAAGILLVIFFRDLKLDWWEGLILFSTLVLYIYILIRQKYPVEEELPEGTFRWYHIPELIVGAAVIVTAAHFLVSSASDIARFAGLSEWFIGITIVAAGTSAPELATSVAAIVKGKHGISVGNLIGSDLFNMLGVLGVASMLRPLRIQTSEYTGNIILAVSLGILLIMMRTGWKITKTEAVLLICIALFRWSFEFIF